MAAPNAIIANPLGFNKPALSYAEYIDKGDVPTAAFQFGSDSTQASLTIDIPWNEFLNLDFAWEILGRSSRQGDLLHRELPWQCPYIPWLWATRIDNLHGVKFLGKHDARNGGGKVNYFDRARMTVTFTTLPYTVYDDNKIATVFAGDESERYVDKRRKTTAEFISLDKQSFRYTEGTVPRKPNGLALLLGLNKLNVKVDLDWTWYDVPNDYLFNADGVESRLIPALGCVNATDVWGFPIGTLLMLPYEMTPTAQPASPLLLGFPSISSPPRTWAVRFLFKFWDPERGTGATTRGHNTTIWPKDMRFYRIGSKEGNRPQYESYEFRNLFKAAL